MGTWVMLYFSAISTGKLESVSVIIDIFDMILQKMIMILTVLDFEFNNYYSQNDRTPNKRKTLDFEEINENSSKKAIGLTVLSHLRPAIF